ncbi:MAG: serine/threonine protein kinase, partial [Gemmatimonadota bacterium]
GAGEVWRAVDTALERPVAVKLLRAEFAGHPETLARFRAEALRAGSLSHPGIAHVYDYGDADPPHPPFLVMEVVDGPSLAGVLAGGPLEAAQTMDVVAQTAAGLAAAHAAGLIHRDIKPANLLLGPDGQLKITDFGIAHAAGSAPLTRTGTLVGTPGYLAPERAAGRPAVPASDLYSLGIVAYECLTGSVPFGGTPLEVAAAHRERPLPPLPPHVPGPVAALVAELTGKDPQDRPASAGAAAERAGQLRDALTRNATARLPAGPYLPSAAAAGSQPVTLADSRLPGPGEFARRWWAEQSRRWREGGHPVSRMALAAAVVFTVGLVGALLGSLLAGPRPGPPAHPAASSSPAATVDVSAASLAGQPAAAVIAQLRGLGLHPQLVWEHTGRQPAGTVVSVQPAGQIPAGSTVTVTAALSPAGHRHHHGDGNGNGDGGSG